MSAAPPDDDAPEPVSDPETVARIVCLRALEHRARTRSELATLLRKRGVPDEAATTVLDRFTDVGLVNDEALAVEYSRAAHQDRNLSRRAVATKLRQRGVDTSTIDTAVAPIDRDSERAAARRLAERKLRTLGSVDPEAQLRRIVGLLARRGYSSGVAYSVARDVVGGGAAELPDLDAD